MMVGIFDKYLKKIFKNQQLLHSFTILHDSIVDSLLKVLLYHLSISKIMVLQPYDHCLLYVHPRQIAFC